HFPLVRSYELRRPSIKRGPAGSGSLDDPGQAFYVDANKATGEFRAVIHTGPPSRTPTLTAASNREGKLSKGKAAICPFCAHVHPLAVHQRLASEGYGRDAMLLVADLDPVFGKSYREPTGQEMIAVDAARIALTAEPPFGPGLPAIPQEAIPLNNGPTI